MMNEPLDQQLGGSGMARLYRRWLRWYPSEFRLAYGAGMEQTFTERLTDVRLTKRPAKLAAFLIREALGVAASAILHRVSRLHSVTGRGGHSSRTPGPTPPAGGNRRSFAILLLQDAKHAFRSLVKNPGYAIVAVLTLALGIGANSAIFSVVNGVLLKPLPYRNPQQLVQIWETDPQGNGWGFSPPNFESYSGDVALLDDMVAYGPTTLTLTGNGDPERLSAMQISAGFFEFLGSPLAFGREFLPEEDGFVADPGAEQLVILDYGMWQRRFGGDRNVLGEALVLDGVSRTIVGIAPQDLPFGSGRTDVWITWPFDERDLILRGRHWITALGRLQPDVTLEAAATELETIAVRLGESYPESNAGWGILVVPLMNEVVGDVKTPLWILLGAVGLVLLVACANVANLSLARAEARSRELAVRAALGASRSRLLCLLLSESVLLALLGGVAGLGLAWVGVNAVLGGVGSGVPRAGEVSLDATVLGFTTLVALFAGIAVGLIAAWQGMRRNQLVSLKEGGQGALSVGRRRVRGGLVIAEVALSLMLVIGAGLLIKSFWLLTHVDAGFDHRRLLTATISLPEASYQTDAQRAKLFADLVRGVQAAPGVVAAAATTGLPIVGGRITTISLPERPDELIRPIARRRVTGDYFRTMGIPLVAGRAFEVSDVPSSPHVVVINETLSRRIYPDEEALGKHILWGGPRGPESLEIVGIVGDVKQHGLANDVLPAMYLEYAQIYVSESMYLAVRTTGDPLGLTPLIRDALRVLDPTLPIYEVAAMDQLLSDSVGSERFSMLLLGLFAAVALALGSIGIYGVMSYTVSQRTREVGVRMALGAAQANVVALVVRQGMLLTTLGVLLGAAGAVALSRVLTGMLFQVSATDPLTFVSVTILLAIVALIACYLPARRAASVDPLEALRYE